MSLRDLILARIDETPHRAPTHLSIVQSLYPQARACIDAELRAMLAERVIDTEQGDSGLTYIRRKAPHIEPVRPTSPSTVGGGLGFFPSRKSKVLASKDADYIARRAIAEQAAIAR